MSGNSGLTAPGSSTYSSNTLHVGDGTWDSSRDTFLLPNLMGVNFETMRYNGMGNRFRDMPEYHTLIVVHGVIAAIVFLGLVPMSVLIIRYYSRLNPLMAFKYHVWCQVLALLLTTVVFVLGWFAVGPERSLTNPHHGIGLAIYVIIIFQVLWGWLVHKIERGKKRYHVPLKLVIHRWLGRALVILGIVQIPLGLTLYGSPKSLFILFSLAAFGLLAAFFILSYQYDSDRGPVESDYDSRYSYVSRPSVDERRHNSLGRMAAAGAAGAGLAALFRRRNRDHTDHAYENSQSSYMDEKYSDEGSRRGGWGNRLLKIGALGGGAILAKKLFDRRRDRESDTESGRYRPAHNRTDSMTEESLSRLDDGRRPEPSYQAPAVNRPPSRPPSRSQSPGSSYYDSYLSREGEGQSHGVRNTILGAGALAAIKGLFSRRKKNDEQRRVEDLRHHDLENERIARASSNKRRYTGDGYYPRSKRTASFTATDASTDLSRPPRRKTQGESGLSTALPVSGVTGPLSDMPPVTTAHTDLGSGVTAPAPPPPQHAPVDPAPVAGSSHAARRSSSRQRVSNAESPPVSIEMKFHDDNRHVTLRRLTEEEAAASREARRRDRRSSRRRTGSASSLSGNEGSYDRWRRVEELERQQQEQMQREQAAAMAAASSPLPGPPLAPGPAPSGIIPPASTVIPPSNISNLPPPQAPSSLPYGAGSIASPGTVAGTEASEYASNRRRRRAERARARQERQQHSVEFT
ncbi:hypothetical protein P175DRAFT_0556037 [Aspergillus ochraceoroseus IBT 24754]|uniref:Cytochrome b561 domain-containing protein n=3 Tax=Aspergillus subgen. Nidulantes TaxID=2720870 RepID=A0A0F8WLR8_9EURO|nr:uncharacterized protein P175DRAFT_0556037 [Aspergillus ochraceoroseus IBT 24754]KKK12157.1 hypothetical protein AOCH_005345 [Aspergillus ochraceoroseus]KKK12232.1 hypothetical protein ARAM_006644 [Aspergillus rambellii]PTU23394.1 hypothetical protein P175DRAFT_0556037 [Aspergillus ochraceoroseus IBT 24754]